MQGAISRRALTSSRASTPAGSVQLQHPREQQVGADRQTPRANSASRAGCVGSKARAVSQKSAVEAMTNPARSSSSEVEHDAGGDERDRLPAGAGRFGSPASRRASAQRPPRPARRRSRGPPAPGADTGPVDVAVVLPPVPSLRRMRTHPRFLAVDERGRTPRRPGSDRSSGSAPALRATPADCTIASIAASRRRRSALLTPGGATSERQFSSSTSTPCSRSVGASRPGRRSALEMRERRAPCPASMCGANSARPLMPDRHLAAENRGHRFAAAGERDVVDALAATRRRRPRRGRRGSDRCRRPTRRPTRSTRAAP